MKVKVKQTFRDKVTKERRVAGNVIDVTEERYEEIMTKGDLLEKVEEDTKDEEDVELNPEAMKSYTVKQLKEIAEGMGLDTSGKKEELIDRILNEKTTDETKSGSEEEKTDDEKSED